MTPEEKSRRFETIYRLSKEKLELLQKVNQLENEREELKEKFPEVKKYLEDKGNEKNIKMS